MSVPVWHHYTKTYLAEITRVDSVKGVVDLVTLDGLREKRENVTMPLGGFSARAHKSSWVRYMPQLFDVVLVSFGPLNQARIVGYATLDGSLEEYEKISAGSNKRTVPAGDFTRLYSGEYDMRSSGGAYIRGSKDGTLLLSGGPLADLRLIKAEAAIRGETDLLTVAGSGCELRFGGLRRRYSTDFEEREAGLATSSLAPPIPLDPTATNEFAVNLGIPALGSSVDGVSYELGSVRAGQLQGFIPAPSTRGGVLRARTRVFSVSGLVPLYESNVDSLGNASVTGINADATLAGALNVTVPAVTVTAANIQLGGPTAIDANIKGTAFFAAFAASLTQLSVEMTVLATGLADAAATFPLLAPSLTAAAGGATAAALTASSLGSSLSTYLSTTVFTT